MYIHGLWLNATFMLIYDGDEIREKGLLHGYTAWAWAAIVTNAFVGLAVSAVLKYCDNIARVYAAPPADGPHMEASSMRSLSPDAPLPAGTRTQSR